MTDNTHIISFVFRLINAAVLIGVGIYAYIKHIRGMVNLYMQEKRLVFEGCIEQSEALNYQKSLSQEQQSAHHVIYERLKKNVVIWNRNLQEIKDKQEKEQIAVQAKIAQAAEIVCRYRSSREFYIAITPKVFLSAKQELTALYSAPTAGQEYIKRSIDNLIETSHE